MKMKFKNIMLNILFVFTSLFGFSQEKLSKQEAVDIALENNYDIKVTSNNVEVAKNNSSIYNSGYLPILSANGGANYEDSNVKSEFRDGSTTEGNLSRDSYNASVGINYVIFDGLGRKYNYKKSQELYNFSEIQARQVIENTVLQLLAFYYEIARLSENEANQKQSLDVSKSRLLREKYNYQYGQNTQLDVLNSEVDLNNDSITYLNISRELSNAKRNLNVVLGRDINADFMVDTLVTYTSSLTYDNLLIAARENNAQLLQAEKQVELSNFDLKINQSGWMPSLGINGSYGYSDANISNELSNQVGLTSSGFNAGLNLSWNIFDGGTTKTRVQNAKIAIDSSTLLKEQIEQDLERNVANAWETYQNSLFILKAEEKNVQTNRRNFSRTEEQFKLGQVISVEYRFAQINFLNAANNYNKAKYVAKVAELRLLQLSGELLGANY